MNNNIQSQAITGGCNKVTVTNFPNYPNNYYACCAWKPNDNDPCSDVLTNGHPAGVNMDLQKYNFSTNQWDAEVSNQNSNTSTVFTGLSTGKYRVQMHLPKRLYQSGCPETSIKVWNTAGQWIGWRAGYNYIVDATTNEVWIGEAEISSGDAAFNNYGYNTTAFDSGQIVRVNLTSNPRWSHWKGVIRDEQTLEEYETPWFSVDNNPGSFQVSSVWKGDPFKSLHTYKATIWVNNQSCIAWEPLDMPFFICPQGTGCRLQDQELSISFYPNPATDHIVLQGLDHILQGDQIEATIMDGLGRVVKRFPHLQKSQITISDLTSGMYYLSIFRNRKRVMTEKLILQ